MWSRTLLLSLLFVGFAGAAAAEGIQAQCGEQRGNAYALAGGVVGPSDAGWYQDRLRGEFIVRIDTGTGEADVRFRDATGIWQSVTDQGGTASVFAVNGQPSPSLMVTVVYPGTTLETFIVGEINGARATLVHTVSRAMPQMTNSRIMISECIVTPY